MIKRAKNPQSAIKDIQPLDWYRLADIERGGWILNTVGKASKRYLYRLIAAKQLRVRDHGIGRQTLFRVQGQDIINFIQQNYL